MIVIVKDKDCSDCYDDGYRDGYENAYEEQESNLDDLRGRIALLEAVAEAALFYFGACNTVGVSANIVRKPLQAAGYLGEE
jgi:hypothetical protein